MYALSCWLTDLTVDRGFRVELNLKSLITDRDGRKTGFSCAGGLGLGWGGRACVSSELQVWGRDYMYMYTMCMCSTTGGAHLQEVRTYDLQFC